MRQYYPAITISASSCVQFGLTINRNNNKEITLCPIY